MSAQPATDPAGYAEALDELEAHITSLTDQAIASLQHANLTAEAKDELVALANYVSWRVV